MIVDSVLAIRKGLTTGEESTGSTPKLEAKLAEAKIGSKLERELKLDGNGSS